MRDRDYWLSKALVLLFVGFAGFAVGSRSEDWFAQVSLIGAAFAVAIAMRAYQGSVEADRRMARIERLLERVANAVAPEVEAPEAAERSHALPPVDVEQQHVARPAARAPLREDDDGLAGE